VAESCPRGAHAASLKPRAAARPVLAAPESATRPELPRASRPDAPPHADGLPVPARGSAPSLAHAPAIGSRRGRRAGFRAQACAVLLVALVAGFAAWATLRARDERLRPPAGDRVVAIGGVTVSVPPDWRPATRPAGVLPGLGEPAAILEPYPGMRLYAVLTLASEGIPRALTDLTGPLGYGRPAQLAGRPALAYPARPVGGDRVAEVTVARSPSGALVVACIARTASWGLAAHCAEQVGPTLGGQ
jgi:hypothetical protein